MHMYILTCPNQQIYDQLARGAQVHCLPIVFLMYLLILCLKPRPSLISVCTHVQVPTLNEGLGSELKATVITHLIVMKMCVQYYRFFMIGKLFAEN